MSSASTDGRVAGHQTGKLSAAVEPGSFRDRHGRVFYDGDAVLRGVSQPALDDWEMLEAAPFFQRLHGEGKIVRTRRVEREAVDPALRGEWAGFLEHERIPFVSYPYEWSFGMLKDAALLQLELLDGALEADMILKDASAFNVQWRGASPVFIDTPSFQRLSPGEPWSGYRQFCQMFLYPLFLQAYKDVAFQPWLRGSIDGIPVEDCARLMSARDLLRRGVLTHVVLQARMQASYAQTRQDVRRELKSAGFRKELIAANARRLTGLVERLSWRQARSAWSHYAAEHSYTDADHARKAAFVREVVHERPRRLVWDLGCNTGTFSRIAAENAAYVVAMDADHLAVERLYQSLKAEGVTTILPLVNNLADPSPALGWRLLERKSLPERGRPDLTLVLALIHHIVIGANIPLPEFIAWLSGLGTDLVIEFVTREDPMVQTLLRNKEDQYDDYQLEVFEASLERSFSIVRREPLGSGTRILYHARNRAAVDPV